MGRHREAGVIIDELEDHAFAAAGEDILGRVQLPARVRRRVDEPAIRSARLLLRSARATPARRKIRATDAVDGTGSILSVRILSCTLIGP